MPAGSDSDLMRRYAQGNPEAFEELFRRYERRAYAYFLRRTQSVDRAQDLYQELFLRIHRFRSSFDPALEFKPWFYRIASRVLVDDFRRQHSALPGQQFESGDPSYDPDVEGHAILAERTASLLSALSQEQRDVLVASKIIGMEYAEISDRLGRSLDAVKQAASRTLRKLRAMPGI